MQMVSIEGLSFQVRGRIMIYNQAALLKFPFLDLAIVYSLKLLVETCMIVEQAVRGNMYDS